MGYLDNAIATTRGWVSPAGELLKSQRMTQAQVDAHNGVSIPEEVEMKPEPVQQLNEAPASKSIDDMNKLELESVGRQYGVELDRRSSKSPLLGQIKTLID